MEQLVLGEAKPRRARRRGSSELATDEPIAVVALDVAQPHLDRPFEYTVPAKLEQRAVAGARVRVRFAGRLVDGFILKRADQPEHSGRLLPLERVNGTPVLTPEIADLARAVADRYAGTLADVLRSAVPPRHAGAEKAWISRSSVVTSGADDAHLRAPQLLPAYAGGAALLRRLAEPQSAIRAALTVGLTDDPGDIVAELASAAAEHGSVLIVVPDARDVVRFARALSLRFGERVHALTAGLGPRDRYRGFLDVLSGDVRVVVGTRAAAFAPSKDLALCVIWDDGDESHGEPRTPGWHAREVLALRSLQTGCAFVAASHSRSVEVQRMASSHWARSIVLPRATARAQSNVATADDQTPQAGYERSGARLPHVAWDVANRALRAGGPVLVQVGRSGYVPAIACATCRTIAHCAECEGPLALSNADSPALCRWCGQQAEAWRCDECSGQRIRALTVGVQRTAEELGRSFPNTRVLVSGRSSGVISKVPDEPLIVVATVGAEPIADNGYSAALLLDGDALLARAGSRSEEETVRLWFNAVALVRPGAPAVVTADHRHAAAQALVRNDPVGWAERELAHRTELQLPPAVRVAAITGSAVSVMTFLDQCNAAGRWRVLGPVAVPERPNDVGSAKVSNQVRALLTAPMAEGEQLMQSVRAALAATSSRTGGRGVHVRVDPIALL